MSEHNTVPQSDHDELEGFALWSHLVGDHGRSPVLMEAKAEWWRVGFHKALHDHPGYELVGTRDWLPTRKNRLAR